MNRSWQELKDPYQPTPALISQVGADNHAVPCAAGGQVMLDAPLFYLWQLAQSNPFHKVVTTWSTETDLPPLLGSLALELLQQGQLLPTENGAATRHLPPPPDLTHTPMVSVVIVNRNGQHHLAMCLPSLAAQTYPNLEIIVVDNHSDDDSLTWLAREWPHVQVIPLTEDVGFSGANNRGMNAATGAYFFLLNNDTRLAPDAITRLMGRLANEDQVGAVVPLICLMSQPAFVNALGNTLGAHGWGSDGYIGHLDVGQLMTVRRVPSACFAAVLIPRTTIEAVGPMDETYHYYYEDLDWSWRARLKGFHILAEPTALVYHAFGGTTTTRPWPYKLRLVARNRLRFTLKNLEAPYVRRFIRNYLREDVTTWWHARRRGDKDIAQAYSTAWWEFIKMLPQIRRQRHALHAERFMADDKIFQEMGQIPPPRQMAGHPFLSINHIAQDYGPHLLENGPMMTDLTPELNESSTRPHLLIVSPDVVKQQMAGPGIRYWELAHVLAKGVTVTLAVPGETDLTSETVRLTTYNPKDGETVRVLLPSTSVVFGAIDLLFRFPFLATAEIPIIIDLYAPFLLENLEMHRAQPMGQRTQTHAGDLEILRKQIQYGDFFVCASDRQRDLWLGTLLALNRVNPLTYSYDESLRSLIDVVPFGIADEPPQATRPVLKGVVPGIAADDLVILWGGGIWNWLDPLTPIRAMAEVIKTEPRARLYFMGGRHPNPIVPEMQMAVQAEALAVELGLLNKIVFFNHQWVPYQERVNYLLEADAAVSAHQNHIETHFAFRTRLLDCIWAGLPVVMTEGDKLAEIIEFGNLGSRVPAGDVATMANQLVAILQTPGGKGVRQADFALVQAQFRWSEVARPLLNFCQNPHLAVDRAADIHLRHPQQMMVPPPTPLLQLPTKAVRMLIDRGPLNLLAEISRYLLWRLSR